MCAIFLALLLKPSFQIPSILFVEPPVSINSEIHPGSAHIFSLSAEVKSLYVDKRPLSNWKTHFAFGVFGIPGRAQAHLFGEMAPQPGHAFRPPLQKIFIQMLTVKNQNSDNRVSIRLPASVIQKLNAHDEETRMAERELMRKILAQENGGFGIACWQRPLRTKIVSHFASPRTLPDGHQYYHTGTDFRAAMNTPIHASSAGTVVFAQHMIVPGNMIVIDHGGGLFSRYMHLNKFNVQVGQSVQKNEVIGYSGATGRVEAPHLHWEIVWKGIPADPLRFLEVAEQTCDRG